MTTKIIIGADHRGFGLKESFISYLKTNGFEYNDMGAYKYDKDDDYPDFVFSVCDTVTKDPTVLGVLFCGSSLGITAAANKVRGIIATNPRTPEEAIEDRDHHGGNVLCISADHIDIDTTWKIFTNWFSTPFSGGRHERRIQKIKKYENLE